MENCSFIKLDNEARSLLKKMIHDNIVIYELQDKNILFLFFEYGNIEVGFANEFKGKIDRLDSKLKHNVKFFEEVLKTADGRSENKCGIEYDSSLNPFKEGFWSFDAIFVLNLGRMLTEKEILNACLLLTKEGVLFLINPVWTPWVPYCKYVTTTQLSYGSLRGIEFFATYCYMESKTAKKDDEFFRKPDWHEKVFTEVAWRFDKNENY